MLENIFIYGGLVIGAAMALRGLALEIVKRTDTPRDDEIVGQVYKVLEGIAGVLPEKYKAKIAMPRGGAE